MDSKHKWKTIKVKENNQSIGKTVKRKKTIKTKQNNKDIGQIIKPKKNSKCKWNTVKLNGTRSS